MQFYSFARRARGVVLLAGAAWALPAHAGPITPGLVADTQATEWVVAGPVDQDLDSDSGPPGPVLANTSAALPAGQSTTSTDATADFGFVETVTHSVGTYTAGPGQLVNAQGISNASFREDSVVVEAPGFGPGQFGSLVARFEIDHVVNLVIDVLTDNGGRIDIAGGFDLEIVVGDAVIAPFNGVWTNSTVAAPTSPTIPSGTIEIPVNFEYGVPFTIAADLEINLFTTVVGDISADVDAMMNLGSAFFWQGMNIDDLPDGATVSSENVEDWTLPYNVVPAPATGALLPALAGLAARRRRR